MPLEKLHTTDDKPYTGFADSRQGGRADNQDSYLAAETSRGFLVTVCDGMGGGPGGATASAIAVREIAAALDEADKAATDADALAAAIEQANTAIIAAAALSPTLTGMGSTATALLLTPRAAIVAHAGDSRVYQLRGRRKLFRTFDHSMVFDQVRQKTITEEQARLMSSSNVITRALGTRATVGADVAELPYERGDRFVLCTDGVHSTLPERRFLKLVGDRSRPLNALTDHVLTQIDYDGRLHGGGHDNMTLAMIDVKTNSTLKQPMTRRTRLLLLALTAALVASIALNIVQALA